jgi:hypothetical protein
MIIVVVSTAAVTKWSPIQVSHGVGLVVKSKKYYTSIDPTVNKNVLTLA